MGESFLLDLPLTEFLPLDLPPLLYLSYHFIRSSKPQKFLTCDERFSSIFKNFCGGEPARSEAVESSRLITSLQGSQDFYCFPNRASWFVSFAYVEILSEFALKFISQRYRSLLYSVLVPSWIPEEIWFQTSLCSSQNFWSYLKFRNIEVISFSNVL